MNFIVFVNGVVLMFFAALMGLDALIFPSTADAFGLSAILDGVIGGMFAITALSAISNIRRPQTFILTSSVWLTGAIAGAIPLYLWSMSGVDALFESMSGITTTGSTVMSGLDTTPRGIIFWRAILQAVGGVGFVVTGIALLPILKVGGMQLFRTESSDKGGKELSNAAVFASATLKVYVVLIILCTLAYEMGGMSAFDAVTHALTTVSSGGYSGYDASFGHFTSSFLQWTATLFMLLGALPFAWYIRVIYRGTFQSEQVRMMLWSLGIVISGLTIWLMQSNDIAFLDALRLVAFNVVSTVTTTGYATTDYTTWGPFAAATFFVLTAVGGCTGSTAGGVKAMRWLLAGRAIIAQIKKINSPNRIISIKYEGRHVDDSVLSGVVSFFLVFFITTAVIALTLSFLGLDFSTSISGALTALANVGPGVGDTIGPAGNFASLSDPVKLVLIFAMYIGRLEMMTFFVLLTPKFWESLAQ